ncbi:hypothetical protein [Azohydromonas aeria]|uniref:hypothetical protein n=1 Tax=Azohydromonas aeria TaxID=2590212 RepID=UPI0012F8F4A2|nr:hypothetical protein [Azohydromonas aeria]
MSPADPPADSSSAPIPEGIKPDAAPDATATPAPVDWSEESTAGEEDPGASLDLALDPPPQQPPPDSLPPAAPAR